MLTRLHFVKLAAAFTGAPALPAATPRPWDACDRNTTLPYDRPLGLRMRVLDGPDFDLVKYRGYAVILHIFATWCEPCALEMPAIVRASQRYADRGLRVVGIDFRESDDTVRAYRKRFGITFPIAMDERGGFVSNLEVGTAGASLAFPVSLYITPAGYLSCYVRGATAHEDAELDYRIQKFLKDAPPSTTSAM